MPPWNDIYPYPLRLVQNKIYYECHLVWFHTLPQAGNELGWYWSDGWHHHVWTGDRGAGGPSALCTCKLFFGGGAIFEGSSMKQANGPGNVL